MAEYGQVLPLAEDRNVDLASIEQELRRLSLGAADVRDDTNAPVTRVSILNLIALAPDARSACRASEAGTAITARYPCRVIVATADRSGSTGLEASISAYCHPAGPSAKPVCCERVSLYASGKCVDQLSWAITPLLVPDVPVFVWIQGDPDPGDLLHQRLIDMAERLIVDLQSAAHPERAIASLAAHSNRTHPDVTDMAWRRTAQWREMVASLFDPPAFRTQLPALRSVEIGYTPGGSGWSQAQPALVGAWIADRLGWEAKGRFKREADTWTLKTSSPTGPGQVILKPEVRPGSPPEELTSVRFPSAAGGASFSIGRSRKPDLAELQILRPGLDPLTWTHPLHSADTAWLLGQELERPHGSPAFERVLTLLNGLL